MAMMMRMMMMCEVSSEGRLSGNPHKSYDCLAVFMMAIIRAVNIAHANRLLASQSGI